MTDYFNSKLPIGAVERETGLSKDTLRAWEKRYGFPQPSRDENGDRTYAMDQVERLQLIKRLIDSGHRPGKIIQLTAEELKDWLHRQFGPDKDREHNRVVALLRTGNPVAVSRYLRTELASRGLEAFVTEMLPEMNEAVGDAWLSQAISVAEEHLYTEVVQNILRQSLQPFPHSGDERPRVLLTTLPGEHHTLGLLMAQTMLTLAGADVRSFGIQMPLHEIATVARSHQVDIVALSFSAAYPLAAAVEDLTGLRSLLPSNCLIWAGGAGINQMRQVPDGVRHLASLDKIKPAVNAWREEQC